jgi:hypothetical protein
MFDQIKQLIAAMPFHRFEIYLPDAPEGNFEFGLQNLGTLKLPVKRRPILVGSGTHVTFGEDDHFCLAATAGTPFAPPAPPPSFGTVLFESSITDIIPLSETMDVGLLFSVGGWPADSRIFASIEYPYDGLIYNFESSEITINRFTDNQYVTTLHPELADNRLIFRTGNLASGSYTAENCKLVENVAQETIGISKQTLIFTIPINAS